VKPWLTIVGVGAGGVGDLPVSAQAMVAAAGTVLGSERLLGGLAAGSVAPAPTGEGVEGKSLAIVPWQPSLSAMREQVNARRGSPTVVLATGDPMWFGIGATLAARLEHDEYEVIPSPSAFQLAAARLRWPLQHVATISLHGRPVEAMHPHLLPGNRVLALTSDRTTLEAAKRLLLARGYGQSLMMVLENLGGSGERIGGATASALDAGQYGDFHVLAVDCVAGVGAALLPTVPGLPDEAFVSDGQLSKREVRAATLAKLAPYPGARLWDVGAGCGSVAIEWLRAARDAAALAFERDGGRREMIATNARALGVPGLEIVGGEAPASLAGHAEPDAVFIGGDVGNAPLFDACWAALRPGGRLVANAVTLDAEAALYDRQARLGGELTRLEISVMDRLGRDLDSPRVMRPRLAVTQWLVVKP
jgi:precorrin-6B C5,15-methyltransferase / cobalt-precorrin-6B C5,C15-methyltransferase